MHREKGFLEIPEGSQLVKTAVKNDLIHKTPEGPENMEQIQPEGVVGSMEHPAGMPETGTDMEMVRKIHTSKEDHHIEGKGYAVSGSGCLKGLCKRSPLGTGVG